MNNRTDSIEQFITALGELDRAGLARLKRNAGNRLAKARDAQRVFFQVLPYDITRAAEQEDFFLVATLFPLMPHTMHGINLGTTLRRVKLQRTDAGDNGRSLIGVLKPCSIATASSSPSACGKQCALPPPAHQAYRWRWTGRNCSRIFATGNTLTRSSSFSGPAPTTSAQRSSTTLTRMILYRIHHLYQLKKENYHDHYCCPHDPEPCPVELEPR